MCAVKREGCEEASTVKKPNERTGPKQVARKRGREEISRIMRRVKSRDTGPEVLLRKALWSRGLRYRLCDSSLPGKPDIVFRGRRVAIFVDGDFWHGNQWRRRRCSSLEAQFQHTDSKGYWIRKIRRNIKRDRENTARLMSMGWAVLRFWECDLGENLRGCVDKAASVAKEWSAPYGLSALPDMTFAEFFAGIGLMRAALENREWEAKFGNDIDPQKYEMYCQNFAHDPACQFRVEDIHNLSGEDVPSVTMATASFPCNDLSLAGSRRGLAGKQSGSVWQLIRILMEMGVRRPPIVMLENATGFLSSHGGTDMAKVLLRLNDLGYSCDAFILNAASFVAQSRPRLFIIAALTGQKTRGREAETWFLPSELRPRKLERFIVSHPEIAWRLRDLPPPPSCGSKVADILEDLPRDAPEWWSRERAKYLHNQMSEKHSAIADAMMKRGEYSYGTVFRRVRHGKSMAELRVDGIAGCLRTPRGGSGRQILFKAGKGEYHVRLLTPRECARLMGASDDYRIGVPLNQALFGFGDAVCVPVIEWIAENYLNPLVTEILRGEPLVAFGQRPEGGQG